MARPVRIEFPGALYHVMSHGVDGTATFTEDSERRIFLKYLSEIVHSGKLIIHAFCLMLNHFHLLCETPASGLSRHMQRLLVKYTRLFNRRHNRQGHLWQARYKAILVEDGDYFLQCSRYIHLNPVKAGICALPEDYPWSSYSYFLGKSRSSELVTTLRTLNSFESKPDYVRYVLQGMPTDLANPFEEAIGGLVYGSPDFVDRLLPLIKKPQLEEDVPAIQNLDAIGDPSFQKIGAAVSEVFPHISRCQQNRIFVYALRRFTQMTGREIANLAGRCPSSITHAWNELQTRLEKDLVFRSQIEALANLLG